MSGPGKDATIAARVAPELRTGLEQRVEELRRQGVHYPDGREVDLSYVIRVGLRAWLDGQVALATVHELESLTLEDEPARQLDNGRPGHARRNDPDTAKGAALRVASRAGSQRRIALELFEAAADRGLTADEVIVAMAPRPHSGISRRVSDLLQGGLVEPHPPVTELERAQGMPHTRKTRAGAQATVFRITGRGIRALANKRREEASAAMR